MQPNAPCSQASLALPAPARLGNPYTMAQPHNVPVKVPG